MALGRPSRQSAGEPGVRGTRWFNGFNNSGPTLRYLKAGLRGRINSAIGSGLR